MLALGRLLPMVALAACSVPHFEAPRDDRAPDECRRFADERAAKQLACGALAWSVTDHHIEAYGKCLRAVAFNPFGPTTDECIDTYTALPCETIKAGTALEWCSAFVIAP